MGLVHTSRHLCMPTQEIACPDLLDHPRYILESTPLALLWSDAKA